MKKRVKAVAVNRKDEGANRSHALYNRWMSVADYRPILVKQQNKDVFETLAYRGVLFGSKI